MAGLAFEAMKVGSAGTGLGGRGCGPPHLVRPSRQGLPCRDWFAIDQIGSSIEHESPAGLKRRSAFAPLIPLSISLDPSPVRLGGVTSGPPASAQRIANCGASGAPETVQESFTEPTEDQWRSASSRVALGHHPTLLQRGRGAASGGPGSPYRGSFADRELVDRSGARPATSRSTSPSSPR